MQPDVSLGQPALGVVGGHPASVITDRHECFGAVEAHGDGDRGRRRVLDDVCQQFPSSGEQHRISGGWCIRPVLGVDLDSEAAAASVLGGQVE